MMILTTLWARVKDYVEAWRLGRRMFSLAMKVLDMVEDRHVTARTSYGYKKVKELHLKDGYKLPLMFGYDGRIYLHGNHPPYKFSWLQSLILNRRVQKVLRTNYNIEKDFVDRIEEIMRRG